MCTTFSASLNVNIVPRIYLLKLANKFKIIEQNIIYLLYAQFLNKYHQLPDAIA